jgi:SAM-dependent MidA family methyltransferase
LYGPDGFYASGRGAGRDFRTPSTGAPAELASLLVSEFAPVSVTDIGYGDGSLLGALRGLPVTGIEWSDPLPDVLEGLVVACEWLDVVPCDVVADGRLVLVDGAGAESLGGVPDEESCAWLDAWWPSWRSGARAECGLARDQAWQAVVGRLAPGAVAVAIDYGHLRSCRPDGGSLVGYANGRQVVPVPDGSCDLTAGVALDSLGGALLPAPMRGWPDHHWVVVRSEL